MPATVFSAPRVFPACIYFLSHRLLAKLSGPLHQMHTGAFINKSLIKKLSGLFFTNTNHQDSLVFVYGLSQNEYTLAYRECISNNRIWGCLLKLIRFTLAFAHVIPRLEPAAEQRFDVARKELRNETPAHSATKTWTQQRKKQKVASPRYV